MTDTTCSHFDRREKSYSLYEKISPHSIRRYDDPPSPVISIPTCRVRNLVYPVILSLPVSPSGGSKDKHLVILMNIRISSLVISIPAERGEKSYAEEKISPHRLKQDRRYDDPPSPVISIPICRERNLILPKKRYLHI